MNQIPEELIKSATSIEFGDKIRKIGESFDLHVDQIGELAAEIREIVYGQKKSKDFITNITQQLEINNDKSIKIAAEVNKEIFSVFKSALQTSTTPSDISTLEQIGNFTMEPALDTENHGSERVERPEEVIAGIENPTPSQPQNMGAPTKPEVHTDLLVDHLLSGPIVAMEKKTEQKVQTTSVPAPKPSTQPVKPKGPDSYREPIE